MMIERNHKTLIDRASSLCCNSLWIRLKHVRVNFCPILLRSEDFKQVFRLDLDMCEGSVTTFLVVEMQRNSDVCLVLLKHFSKFALILYYVLFIIVIVYIDVKILTSCFKCFLGTMNVFLKTTGPVSNDSKKSSFVLQFTVTILMSFSPG